MGSKKRIVPVRSVLTLDACGLHRGDQFLNPANHAAARLEAAQGPRYTAPMKLLRVISLGLALLPALACAQWQWIDKDGRKVFSDRSPPSDIPARNILKQPGGKAAPVPAEAAAPADVAASAASAPVTRAAANVPKVSGKDAALEEKKKAAELEEAAKKKAAEEKFAKDKAENCERAKRSLQAFSSGQRIRAPNAKGELEVMTDDQRAAETRRLQAITADCKG